MAKRKRILRPTLVKIPGYPAIDAIELHTMGVVSTGDSDDDFEEPVDTDEELQSLIDHQDGMGTVTVRYDVFVHLDRGGIDDFVNCHDRTRAQLIGKAVAQYLGIPCYDYSFKPKPPRKD